ncbi:phosphotransferase [Vibrio ostreicida]
MVTLGRAANAMSEANYLDLIKSLGFNRIVDRETIQSLWAGYGQLVRLFVDDTSVVIKHIQLPESSSHPRGWNTQHAHQRKLKSYQVELNWYLHYAQKAHPYCPQPKPLLVKEGSHELLLVMEDLSQRGFRRTLTSSTSVEKDACLKWLAWFHASHIKPETERLWTTGTYWHLGTRPDELEALADLPLRSAAESIDQILQHSPYQTLVHGDAKLANFCFSNDGKQAAAVDFQYVGGGCAMKDVALFMSSSVPPEQCFEMENWILDTYFTHLNEALSTLKPTLNQAEVELVWRPLFPIAWADFQRFVKGWSPNHWKINAYTEALTKKALAQLSAY